VNGKGDQLGFDEMADRPTLRAGPVVKAISDALPVSCDQCIPWLQPCFCDIQNTDLDDEFRAIMR